MKREPQEDKLIIKIDSRKTIDDLPVILLANAFLFLTPKEILDVRVVSKHFNKAYKMMLNPNFGKIFGKFVSSATDKVKKAKLALVESHSHRQSTVYEYAIMLLCALMSSGGGGSGSHDSSGCRPQRLSESCINRLRILFALLLGASSFGVHQERDKTDDDSKYLMMICVVIIIVTGGSLLIDGIQSTYHCVKKRVLEDKEVHLSRVSTLINPRQTSININENNDNDTTYNYQRLNS